MEVTKISKDTTLARTIIPLRRPKPRSRASSALERLLERSTPAMFALALGVMEILVLLRNRGRGAKF